MRTVNEVSKLTGVSIRALQYYDKIGLLAPSGYTASGYRLYDDTALETLQQILLLKELEFPLKEIAKILSSPGFDREKALFEHCSMRQCFFYINIFRTFDDLEMIITTAWKWHRNHPNGYEA